MNNLQILIACEESQAVTIEFRKRGFEAYSCDLQDCSGGHPEWHYKEDVFSVIESKQWDLMIAFPPCTHLAVSGARHFKEKQADGRQQQAIDFFLKLANVDIPRIALENPIGIMSKFYKKPSQIIQPYYFGDPFQKTTCLWLKNLPLLVHNKSLDLFTDTVTHNSDRGEFVEWVDKKTGKTKRQALWYYEALLQAKTEEERSLLRSKTFPGIARAMAEQWSRIK